MQHCLGAALFLHASLCAKPLRETVLSDGETLEQKTQATAASVSLPACMLARLQQDCMKLPLATPVLRLKPSFSALFFACQHAKAAAKYIAGLNLSLFLASQAQQQCLPAHGRRSSKSCGKGMCDCLWYPRACLVQPLSRHSLR